MKQFTPEMLMSVEPRFSRIEQAPLLGIDNAEIGWHATALSASGDALGSGCHRDANTARIIAISETLERAHFFKLLESTQREEFLLSEYPSSCGFAFGFSSEPARFRAIAEAVERWAWSKWIDEGYAMKALDPKDAVLSPVAIHFASQFESVDYHTVTINVLTEVIGMLTLRLGIVVARSGDGVFPGSRACLIQDDPWEHALVEAWRHLLIYKGLKTDSRDPKGVFGRIKYFGDHGNRAEEQISKARNEHWPEPRLKLLRDVSLPEGQGYLWRALCDDYVPWHLGGSERFVY